MSIQLSILISRVSIGITATGTSTTAVCNAEKTQSWKHKDCMYNLQRTGRQRKPSEVRDSEREHERESVCVCMRACVRACACVPVWVCFREIAGGWVYYRFSVYVCISWGSHILLMIKFQSSLGSGCLGCAEWGGWGYLLHRPPILTCHIHLHSSLRHNEELSLFGSFLGISGFRHLINRILLWH